MSFLPSPHRARQVIDLNELQGGEAENLSERLTPQQVRLATVRRFALWRWLRLYADQSCMIFPGSRHASHAADEAETGPFPADVEIVELGHTPGRRIKGLYAPAIFESRPGLSDEGAGSSQRTTSRTVLFFYGNDMSLRLALPIVDLIRRCGVNILVPEYLGYGISGGGTPTETSCYETADAAYDYLTNIKGVGSADLICGGCSLGGAVAIDLAARRKVAALVSICTFSSVRDVARYHCPRLPLTMFIRHRFESEQKMPRVTCPALIGHSTGDRFIPSSMADRLAAACAGPVTRFTIDGAEHNLAQVLRDAGPAIERAMREFLDVVQSPPATSNIRGAA